VHERPRSHHLLWQSIEFYFTLPWRLVAPDAQRCSGILYPSINLAVLSKVAQRAG